MALVFISHAHGDEALVRAVVALLRDGLDLDPEDFFVSSQGGRGVAPASSIREEILKTIAAAPALIVLVTPASAASPWVWLEAGNRLGSSGKSHPIFVVPSERFVPLLKPVADLRSLCLDDEEDLHELVGAVGDVLGRRAEHVLSYNAALDAVVRTAQTAYSPSRERRARVASWLRRNAAVLAVMLLSLAGLWAFNARRLASAERRAAEAEAQQQVLQTQLTEVIAAANEAVNEEISRTAARFLVLKGVVLHGGEPVSQATVFVSRERPDSGCGPPDCESDTTTTAGEFRLDLTRIQAQNGEDVLLSVMAPGYQMFSKQVRVDVRAMDVALPAQVVALSPAR